MSADFTRRAFEFYRQMGYQPHQAAALAGNAAWESGGRTDIKGDGGKALGLFQWHPDRQANLTKFASQYGLDPKAEQTQLQFADWELKNTEGAAGKKFFSSPDLKSANDAILGYLRPSGYTPDNPMAGHGYVGRYNNAAGLLNEAPMAQTLSMPPSKYIGPAGGGGLQSEADAAKTMPSDADVGIRADEAAAAAKAVNAAVPAKPAPNYNGLIGSGLAMMAAGEAPPPQQAGWQQGGNMPPAVRGNPQLAGLLTDLMRKKNPFAGLLGEF